MALEEKISQLKDEHAAEIVDQRNAADETKAQMEAMFFLGRVKQIDHDARAVATALSAQAIRALEHFLGEHKYKVLGYQTGVDFLEKSEYSPMSKRQYYDRLALIREHGDEIYDLLTSVGISVRAQKMIGNGDLAIKGDKLMIGETEVEVANTGVIKEVLNELFDERRELQAKAVKSEEKISKLESQVNVGVDEIEQLQRNIDNMRAGNPHDRGVARAALSLVELTEHIGELPDKQKAKRGLDVLPLLYTAFLRVKAAYGTDFNFEDVTPAHSSTLDNIAAEVLADDEGLD